MHHIWACFPVCMNINLPTGKAFIFNLQATVCVWVCVCVFERQREGEREKWDSCTRNIIYLYDGLKRDLHYMLLYCIMWKNSHTSFTSKYVNCEKYLVALMRLNEKICHWYHSSDSTAADLTSCFTLTEFKYMTCTFKKKEYYSSVALAVKDLRHSFFSIKKTNYTFSRVVKLKKKKAKQTAESGRDINQGVTFYWICPLSLKRYESEKTE